MKICGLQKLSLLDYPGYAAATVFTGGCNLRCGFCHNAPLVTAKRFDEVMSEQELLSFLKKRHGLLDGVCITGGEPLLQPDIAGFIRSIKMLGFDVKLDTNGCYPERLESLLAEGTVDYIAMDIKNCLEKYPETVGIKGFDTAPIMKSIGLIMASGVPYEFRTTLVRELHTLEDVRKIGRMIEGAERYFLQGFKDSGALISPGFNAVDLKTAQKMLETAGKYVQHAELRG